MGVDVVERFLILLFDCSLQVADSLRTQDVNWKGVRIVKADNPAGERDFGGHVRAPRLRPRDRVRLSFRRRSHPN